MNSEEDTFMSSTTATAGDTYSESNVAEDPRAFFNARKGGDVRFRSQSSIEQVRRISRISNYDMEEIIDYWGDSDEHMLRKSELKKAVKEMHYNRRESDNDFTTLGLDDKAGHGRAVRKVNKTVSRTAVMDEQELQHHEGILDEELLADVYAITSTAAKKEAQRKAERLHYTLNAEGK